MTLDVVTLLIIAIAIELIGALFLFLFLCSARGSIDPRSKRSVLIWAISHVLVGTALFALALRGIAPIWLTMILGNAILLLGADLRRVALSVFWARKSYWQFSLVPGLIWIALCLTTPVTTNYTGVLVYIHTSLTLIWIATSIVSFACNDDRLRTSNWLAVNIFAAALIHFYVVVTALAPQILALQPYVGINTAGGYLAAMAITLLATVVLVFAMVMEREKHRYQQLAHTDSLTGLANRRSFMEQNEGWLQKSTGTGFAVIMVDLDHFKTVNDIHGHATGDRVLQIAANTLRAHAPKSAIIGRMGGEEFAIFLPDCSVKDAWIFTETIREFFPVEVGRLESAKIQATLSAGYHHDMAGVCELSNALRQADRALYDAKNSGRNRVYCSRRVEAATSTVRKIPISGRQIGSAILRPDA